MAFSFDSLGQEIHVWYILNKAAYSYDGPNKEFYDALVRDESVELNDGYARLIDQSKADRYEGNAWIVFEYQDKHWRMDINEYDSWDEGDEPTEPYEVIAKPVNEVQYVRVR
jgi:hypothetical protein